MSAVLGILETPRQHKPQTDVNCSKKRERELDQWQRKLEGRESKLVKREEAVKAKEISNVKRQKAKAAYDHSVTIMHEFFSRYFVRVAGSKPMVVEQIYGQTDTATVDTSKLRADNWFQHYDQYCLKPSDILNDDSSSDDEDLDPENFNPGELRSSAPAFSGEVVKKIQLTKSAAQENCSQFEIENVKGNLVNFFPIWFKHRDTKAMDQAVIIRSGAVPPHALNLFCDRGQDPIWRLLNETVKVGSKKIPYIFSNKFVTQNNKKVEWASKVLTRQPFGNTDFNTTEWVDSFFPAALKACKDLYCKDGRMLIWDPDHDENKEKLKSKLHASTKLNGILRDQCPFMKNLVSQTIDKKRQILFPQDFSLFFESMLIETGFLGKEKASSDLMDDKSDESCGITVNNIDNVDEDGREKLIEMIQTKVEKLSEDNRDKVYKILQRLKPDFEGDYITALDDETATTLWKKIEGMPETDGPTKSESATEEEEASQAVVEPPTQQPAVKATRKDVEQTVQGVPTPEKNESHTDDLNQQLSSNIHDPQMIRNLITQGANPNYDHLCGAMVSPPLHIAVMRGHAGSVEALIKSGADVNKRDLYGQTPPGQTPLGTAQAHASNADGQAIIRHLMEAGAKTQKQATAN